MEESTRPGKLLILDLDETLVYAATDRLPAQEADFQVGPYFIYKRPSVDAFLETCLQWFEVAVWTSSSPAYATGVVSKLFKQSGAPVFLWASDRCTRAYDAEHQEHYWRKNVAKVRRKGYRLESVIVVDDTPQKWETGYGNLIRVKPFEGDASDDELQRLLPFLNRLREEGNIRKVEKRYWRQSIYYEGQ